MSIRYKSVLGRLETTALHNEMVCYAFEADLLMIRRYVFPWLPGENRHVRYQFVLPAALALLFRNRGTVNLTTRDRRIIPARR